jgi:aspartate/methionine/tyrosine aminotransferase
MALLSLLNPGDEVLLPDPAWFHYTTLVRLCGATPVSLPVRLGEKVCLDMNEAEQRVTDRTKVLILNSPCNPTGMMISRDDLKAISEFVERKDLTVISDEVYEKITYPGNTHTSPASLSALKERTLTSNGFSKGYAMTGWRVGYLAGPAEIIEKVTALNGYILVCPSSVSQRAALIALTDPRMNAVINSMVERFANRRKMVLDALADLPGIRAYPPQGTFYAWIDISGTGMSSEQFTYKLIESERVGLLPGNLFGEQGKGHVRICFAAQEDLLAQALERIRTFILRKS